VRAPKTGLSIAVSEQALIKAFLSYSWDDENHKRWMRGLAARLRDEGIGVIFDQWDLNLGDQLPEFMETAVRESDFVLVVCTPGYKEKCDGRKGGVGYEDDVITGEVLQRKRHGKFIPMLRRGNPVESIPTWMGGKLFVDFREASEFERSFASLISALKGRPPDSTSHPDLAPAGEDLGCVGRGDEFLKALNFVHFQQQRMLVTVGPQGMGKSAFLAQVVSGLRSRESVFLIHQIEIGRTTKTTDFCQELTSDLSRGLPSWQNVGRVPRSFRIDGQRGESAIDHLARSLNLAAGEASLRFQRIVIVIDPYDEPIEARFRDLLVVLARKLAENVKFIVAQRPSGPLAAADYLGRPDVVHLELGNLDRSSSDQMAGSYLQRCLHPPRQETLDAIWAATTGWPLAIVAACEEVCSGRQRIALSGVSQRLEPVFESWITACSATARKVLGAIAIAPLDLFVDDLSAMAGVTAAQRDKTLANPSLRRFIHLRPSPVGERIRVFHALFRDHIRAKSSASMAEVGFGLRLMKRLGDVAVEAYSQFEQVPTYDRDLLAYYVSSKLTAYRELLRLCEPVQRMNELLWERISSDVPGGRSFSLYSLLVLAGAGALNLTSSQIGPSIRRLSQILYDSSFIYPQYAAILLGHIAATASLKKREASRIISQMDDIGKSGIAGYASTARFVWDSLKKGIDPLQMFSIEDLLPQPTEANE
jgi:hypothetical protein